jgi:tetratricopeptide (TPR) repeat protein
MADQLPAADLSALPGNELKALKAKALAMIQADPLEAKYHFTAGNIELFSDNNEAAFASYQKAVALTPANSEMVQFLGIAADGLGKPYAKELLEQGVGLAPHSSGAALQFGRWLLFKGRKAEAGKALHSAISVDHQSIDESIQIMESADFSAQEMLDVIPKNIRAQYRMGRYLAKIEKVEEAERAYDETVRLLDSNKGPENLKTWQYESMAMFYSKQGQYDKAVSILAQGINRQPENVLLYSAQGKYYGLNGELAKAITAYDKAISLAPEVPEAFLGLGAVLADSEKLDEAEKTYKKALGLLAKSNNAQAWMYYTIIDFYEKKKDLSAAYDAAQKGVSAFPDSAGMDLKLGWLCTKIGKKNRAEIVFAQAWKALQQEPSQSPWMFRSVANFYVTKDPAKAIEILQKGIELFPTDSSLLFRLGDIYWRTGQITEAKELLSKGLTVSPDNEEATRKLKELEQVDTNR